MGGVVIIDLFAGPGGWSTGLRMIDQTTPMVGFELDDSACDTAEAAGHTRHRGDLSALDPRDFGPATGLIASPPCPGFSAAGKGLGRKDLELIIEALPTCDIEMVRLLEHDHRSSLTLEPMRWIRIHRPEWVAMEQVPAVLPIWQAYAEFLRTKGYSAEAFLVQAEQYGVPQTRKRAVMLASRTREVSKPTPTHSRYHSRSPERLDDGVLPWVSMAEALGWGMGGRPSPTVTGGGTDTGGAEPIAHLSRYTSRSDWKGWGFTNRPSYTLAANGGKGSGVEWGGESQRKHMKSLHAQAVETGDVSVWVPKSTPPREGRGGLWNTDNENIRVSVQEAGVLQSFPHDYPWRGSKSQQYQQAGNAVPPLLAESLLREVHRP